MDRDFAQQRAYHQAGRAVVCVTLFGARVVKTLDLDGETGSALGFETYSRLPVPLACRPPSHKRGEDRKPIPVEGIVDAHGVMAYAGIAAQREYLRRNDEAACEAFDHHTAGTEGREQLSKLASSIGLERATDHFYDEYWSEAQRLLLSEWHVVEQVAAGLVQHHSLNGRRVDSLIMGEEMP